MFCQSPTQFKAEENTMGWIELKRALLYGKPSMTRDMLQPQTVKTAVREIARLIHFGWIEDLPDDTVQRIQMACHKGECPEIWDEFRIEQMPYLQQKRRMLSRAQNRAKKTRMKPVVCHI
jgi:hypothetical protein